MKHTNFYAELDAIKLREYAELKQAVKEHGGSYEWKEGDWGIDGPIIGLNGDSFSPGPYDVVVHRVYIQDGKIHIIVKDTIANEPWEADYQDILYGQLSIIIDGIPEIN